MLRVWTTGEPSVTSRGGAEGLYSSEVQQPGLPSAALSNQPHTSQAAPVDREQGRAVGLHPGGKVRSRASRHGWPGVSAGLGLGGPPAARCATNPGIDLANAVANNGPGRGRTRSELPNRSESRQRAYRHRRPDLDEPDLATDQPLVLLARRCTGVKNGCGAARDVVSFLVRLRPRISLTPGAGLPRGRSLLLRARGLDSSARPRFPGRYHLAG